MEPNQTETNQTLMPAPEARYRPLTTTKNQHGLAWVRLVLTIFAAIVLIVLIVMLARWIYHKTHHKTVTVPTTSQTAPVKSTSTPTTSAPTSNTNSSASQPTNTSTTPTTSTTPVNSTQITNTGPGNVAGLFVGASLAAAGLHYIISLRRLNKTES